jgi:ADP-heptose:LPS heptosyltransferase
MDGAPMRILFIPVSGPRGAGEYARMLAIASQVARRWPEAAIHFVVSRAAPYADSVPFPATLVESSPTYHPREVAATIAQFRPTLVLFDNAGRTSQLQAARRAGARIVYVSSRVRQRRKGFRLRWMRMLDEHWIAYPAIAAGALGPLERCKLQLLGRPVLRFLDAMLPPHDATRAQATLAGFGLDPDRYVLVVPGGGTANHGARGALEIVAEAAARIAAHGHPTLLVGATAPDTMPPQLQVTRQLPVAPFADLLRNARLVVSNGGYTMLQALACHRPCVAVPIAGDQQHRIDRCVEAGVVAASRLDAAGMERQALAVLTDEALRAGLVGGLERSGIVDGTATALAAIAGLHGLERQ